MKTVYDDRYRVVIQQLRDRRMDLGLDQRTVAAKLGYTNRWLSKVEHRDIRLDIMQFVLLCRVLGLRSGRLIRRLEQEVAPDEGEPLLFLSGANIRLRRSGSVRAGNCPGPFLFSSGFVLHFTCSPLQSCTGGTMPRTSSAPANSAASASSPPTACARPLTDVYLMLTCLLFSPTVRRSDSRTVQLPHRPTVPPSHRPTVPPPHRPTAPLSHRPTVSPSSSPFPITPGLTPPTARPCASP